MARQTMLDGGHMCSKSRLIFLRSLQNGRGIYKCARCHATHVLDTRQPTMAPGWNRTQFIANLNGGDVKA